MFDNSTILITGGTGSFGYGFVEDLTARFRPAKIIVFSRDEMKQWKMKEKFAGNSNLRFFLGDVRDRERVYRAVKGVDYVVHAAATKIVESAEYNPFECIKTNVNGAMNIIDACIDNNIKKVVALSTDKASSPANLYGASKLVSDKLFVAANAYSPKQGTIFGIVRYGNVMGSRGSVIPLFLSIRRNQPFPITDPLMTRFMIPLKQGIELVYTAFTEMVGGETFVKKIPSMKIVDIAKAINPDAKFKFIGIRPGEKLHEQMIGVEDAFNTYDYEGYFKILPAIYGWNRDPKRIKGGAAVKTDFSYTSDNNSDWMTKESLSQWIKENEQTFLELN